LAQDNDGRLKVPDKDADDEDDGPPVRMLVNDVNVCGKTVTFMATYEAACDPEMMTWAFSQLYMKLVAIPARHLTESEWFNNFVIICILVAGINVGVQTYEGMEEDPVAIGCDAFVLVVFTIECIMKMFAEGARPDRFFTGKEAAWNDFDFFIVVFCMPGMDDVLPLNVGLLRLMRLMRVAKIVRKIPQLQMIVMGLVGGMKSIGYILVLMFLVFYLYAIAGIFAFRKNDPWHFEHLGIAMLTLFRVSTLEDWTDVMYINMYGCDRYPGGVYVPDNPDVASWKKGGAAGFPDRKGWEVTKNWECEDPNPLPGVSVFFWVTFTVISALVMLSLFIGAVTMSMTSSMEQMKIDADEAQRKKMVAKGREMAEKMKQQEAAGGAAGAAAAAEGGETSSAPGTKADREKRKMQRLLMQAWEGDIEKKPDSEEDTVLYEWAIANMYHQLSKRALVIAEDTRFVNFITFVIVVAGVAVGIGTDKKIARTAGYPGGPLDILDQFILWIFFSEVLIKLVAEEMEPLNYFNSGWNCFDFFVVFGSFTPGGGSLLTMLRLLRLLRVLKLVKSLPQLQVIVTALLMGLNSIGFIAIILFLFFYIFAIIGMILFQKNDPWHFGTLHQAMLTLFRCSTLEDWTDVMYINMYGCDMWFYSDLEGTECVNHWSVDKSEGGCTKCIDPKPQYGLSIVYFVIFIIIGALVLLTLFIGVITTSMEEATNDLKEAGEVAEKVRVITDSEGLSDEIVDMYRAVFDILDLDGGGTIEQDELKIGLEAAGKNFSEEQLMGMLAEVDEDGSGEIDFSEFLQFMLNMKKRTSMRRLKTDDPEGVVKAEAAIGLAAAANMEAAHHAHDSPAP